MNNLPNIQGVFELPDRQAPCEAPAGTLLTDAAEVAGLVLNVACGGKGRCGGCGLEALAGRFIDEQGESFVIDGQPRHILGCRTRIDGGPFRVRVPRHSLVTGGEKVVVDFRHLVQWTLNPTIRKEYIVLHPPTLQDQDGDIERILTALGQRGYSGQLVPSLTALREAPLACRAGGYSITATLARDDDHWRLTRVESGDLAGRSYALAVDIGTTTVVVALVDLGSGTILDSASSYNQQVRRCDDVASRISYCTTPQRLAELQQLVIDATINRLAGLLLARHALAPGDIARMAVSGNAVMTHLFLGVDPTHLGAVPFQPACSFPPVFTASELGLKIHPAAPVDVAPSAGAYIGGDITSDMYVCGLHNSEHLALMVDVGTNAEIAVGNRDRVIACAAPAGPAFEGQGLSCGMRASTGAIDSIVIDPASFACRYTVIGGTAPTGLCGSGLIDFVGQAFQAGLLTPAGRFDVQTAQARNCDRLETVEIPGGGRVLAYRIACAEETDDKLTPLLVTEADIATLLQAKGVIFAAIQIAMKHIGKSFADLRHVYLAGGFARHLDLANAVAMGMLPDIPLDRYQFIGNGSLAGAYLTLVDQTVAPHLRRLASRPDVIELNLDPDFQDAFTFALFLPNMDAGLFPSVRPV